MISEKIRAILSLNNKKIHEAASYLGTSRQSFSNKLNRGHFTCDDLIKIAALCECRIFVELKDGHSIFFDSSDLRQ